MLSLGLGKEWLSILRGLYILISLFLSLTLLENAFDVSGKTTYMNLALGGKMVNFGTNLSLIKLSSSNL